MNVLNNVVDKFVLVEATRTQNNQEKPLYFNENKERYKDFEDKIIHIIVDDYPETLVQWTIENHQRNCIARGLKDCKPDDIIIISDLDEIPDPKIIQQIKMPENIIAFDLNYFCYYLNNLIFGRLSANAPKMLTYKNLKNILDEDLEENKNGGIDANINQGTTTTKIRCYSGPKQIRILNSGWHFGHQGGEKLLILKAHACCEGSIDITIDKIRSELSQKTNMGWHLVPVIIDDTYPDYIINNQDKYCDMVCHIAKFKAKSILKFHFWYINYLKISHKIMKNFTREKISKFFNKIRLSTADGNA